MLSASRAVYESLCSILGRRVAVTHCERLADAHDLLAARPVDVIVVDTELRDCDGAEAVRAIAQQGAHASLIALTLSSGFNGLPPEDTHALFAYLTKPFEAEQVRFVIERAIERAELHGRVKYLDRQIRSSRPAQPPAAAEVPEPERAADLFRRCARLFAREVQAADLATGLAEVLAEAFVVSSVAVFIWDDSTRRYALGAAYGLDEGLVADAAFQHGQGLAKWLAANGVVLRRGEIDRRLDYDDAVAVAAEFDLLRAEVSVPLLHGGRLLGFMTLGRKLSGRAFAEAEIEWLALVGGMGAVAIDNCQAREALAYEKLCAERIVEGLELGIVAADVAGAITACNRAAMTALGLERSPVGDTLVALGSSLAGVADEALRTGEQRPGGEITHEPSGRSFTVSAAPIGGEAPRCEAAGRGVILVLDAREAAPSPGALTHAGQIGFWSDLAARMAHKLKNPLVSIKTFTQLLPERYADDEFRTSFLDVVDAEADKINELADRLLLYSSAPGSEPVPTDVPELVGAVLDGCAGQIATAGVHVVPELDEVPVVMADPERLSLAVRAVIENALDATERGGRLMVRTRVAGVPAAAGAADSRVLDFRSRRARAGNGGPTALAAIELSDTGPGIVPEQLDKVFQPFFSQSVHGIGLGLAIVAKVVQEHGGLVEVRSTPGAGTAVRLLLPTEC